MIFRQLTHDALGCASYLIGDEDAGVAAVVDPRLDIDEYLRLARYLGVRIEHVLETHNHATPARGPAGSAPRPGPPATTSRVTAGWSPRPAPRSTSTATPRPITTTRASRTGGSSRSAR